MTELIARMQAAVDKSHSVYEGALEDFKNNFTLGDTIASEDPGCIAAIPSELTELAKAIGISAPAANDNYPPVVAFTGQAGAGKSTATRYLVENHGYTLVKFAGPLKDMLRSIGMAEDEIEGNYKETPLAYLCGKTPRHAMQTLGSQWGRDCIGKDFWVNIWGQRVLSVLRYGGRVVVDDCRFPNEAAAVRKLGGDVYMIAGRGGIPGEHESERGAGEADLVIANDNTVYGLHRRVEEALKRYG